MSSMQELVSGRAILVFGLLLCGLCEIASAQGGARQVPDSARIPRGVSVVRLRTRSDSDSVLAVANRVVAALARDDTASLRRIAASHSLLSWYQHNGPIYQLTFTKIVSLKLSAFRPPTEMPGTVMAEFWITYREYYPGVCVAHHRKDRLVLSLMPVGRSYHVLTLWMERC